MSAVLTPTPIQKSRKLTVTIIAVAILFLAGFVFVVTHWPFRRAAVLKDLEDESLSKVSIGAFHGTYFPRPGCVLEHVVFQHNPKAGAPPLMTIDRMRVEGSLPGLFAGHVRRILVEGMHVLIPPLGTEHFEAPPRSAVVIDNLVADGAILEVGLRQANQQSLKFKFHELMLSRIGSAGPASFKSRFSNPEPPGEIAATGNFGPWNQDQVGETAVSGDYRFQNADLGAFGGISGLLSSSGKFTGVLNRVEVEGDTDVPRFSVTMSSHQVHLETRFHALVNGENGDTLLKDVTANFGKTAVSANGSIAGKPGQTGKAATLELAAKEGRIQDLLLLFAQSPRAPMSGLVSFKANISIPPEKRSFLKKVDLQGDFGIDAGTFTKSDTQQGVNSLSKGARGEDNHPEAEKHEAEKSGDEDEDPATVLSDLKGHVLLRNGTARFSNLSFTVPGAEARLEGTYNLITEKIDLHGTLRTDSEVSKTTHGMRALMLKVLDPFFKKKRGDYVAPVKITGTYEHPEFGLDLSDRDDKKDHQQNEHAAGLSDKSKH
ncbi:MAG: AsmA-like C-terminal region-containing protein [Terriglobales bacterium]